MLQVLLPSLEQYANIWQHFYQSNMSSILHSSSLVSSRWPSSQRVMVIAATRVHVGSCVLGRFFGFIWIFNTWLFSSLIFWSTYYPCSEILSKIIHALHSWHFSAWQTGVCYSAKTKRINTFDHFLWAFVMLCVSNAAKIVRGWCCCANCDLPRLKSWHIIMKFTFLPQTHIYRTHLWGHLFYLLHCPPVLPLA